MTNPLFDTLFGKYAGKRTTFLSLADGSLITHVDFLAKVAQFSHTLTDAGLAPGDRLPTHRELADRLDLTVGTITRAYREAERRGLLRGEVGGGSHDGGAGALGRSPAACRQLVSRARRHVQAERPRATVPPEEGRALTEAFFRASKTGDMAALTQLLAQDVELVSDGGGKVLATLNPIYGRAKVMRLAEGLARKSGAHLPPRWRFAMLNGLPAILSLEPEGLVQATALEIREGRITKVYVIRNPEKTRHLAAALQLQN